MAQEMLIEKRAFDLCKWMLNHTEKFPKSARFSVAVRIENSLLEFLECIIVANKRQDKTPLYPILVVHRKRCVPSEPQLP